MKLGILVNSDEHLEEIRGMTEAAISRGHRVDIFVMDDGVKLLVEKGFSSLCGIDGVHMSFCEHSTDQLGCKPAVLPEEIVCGSQYDNAAMTHTSDKVIIL